MCKYVCACIVCFKRERGHESKRETEQRRYIDRFVDETIVFELSGWTQTLPSHRLRLSSCVFVFVCPVNWTVSLSLSVSCFLFLSLRTSHCSQWCVYFLPYCLFSPTAIHTHRADLLTFQHRSSSHHDCMYHMLMANVPPTSGWFTADCSY